MPLDDGFEIEGFIREMISLQPVALGASNYPFTVRLQGGLFTSADLLSTVAPSTLQLSGLPGDNCSVADQPRLSTCCLSLPLLCFLQRLQRSSREDECSFFSALITRHTATHLVTQPADTCGNTPEAFATSLHFILKKYLHNLSNILVINRKILYPERK